jgi:hypothetical protein
MGAYLGSISADPVDTDKARLTIEGHFERLVLTTAVGIPESQSAAPSTSVRSEVFLDVDSCPASKVFVASLI